VNEEYTFGRGEECDYCFENHSHGKKLPQYLALSKTHFRVYRVRDDGWVGVVRLDFRVRGCIGYVMMGGWVWSDVHVYYDIVSFLKLLQEKDKSSPSKYLVFIQDKRSVSCPIELIFFILCTYMYMYVHTIIFSALMAHSSMERR
jgi:hypothetical protein